MTYKQIIDELTDDEIISLCWSQEFNELTDKEILRIAFLNYQKRNSHVTD